MADIDSTCRDGVRIAKVGDQQILGEDYCQRAGIKLTKIINEMRESALVLNLEKVTFMASAMIGKLVLMRNQCKEKGISFSVCSLNKHVAEAIQLTQIDKILPIFPDQEQAIAAAVADKA